MATARFTESLIRSSDSGTISVYLNKVIKISGFVSSPTYTLNGTYTGVSIESPGTGLYYLQIEKDVFLDIEVVVSDGVNSVIVSTKIVSYSGYTSIVNESIKNNPSSIISKSYNMASEHFVKMSIIEDKKK